MTEKKIFVAINISQVQVAYFQFKLQLLFQLFGLLGLCFFADIKGPKRRSAELDTSGLVHVQLVSDEELEQTASRPQFRAVPQANISVHEGEPLTLRCIVSGRPKPTGILQISQIRRSIFNLFK